MQFHILSFEGPDAYARAGGLATRVEGLSGTLADLGFETHLWFVGDPELPGHERRGRLELHRWCQWVSRHHPGGVYDGDVGKASEFSRSLPPHLVRVLRPYLESGGRAVILAEEWQTVDTVLHLDWLLRRVGLRERVTILWNANNTFGFDRIPWSTLARVAHITTVSRYMKHCMGGTGADPLVIPNGLGTEAFDRPVPGAIAALRTRMKDRTVLTKMARFDPDKRWLSSIDIVAELKRLGFRPLLVARGGCEPHGLEVLGAARERGLQIREYTGDGPGVHGLLAALDDLAGVDVLHLKSHVDPAARRALFQASHAVLANSGHEPFGLVGLETMAAGGLACTGCSGEDYAVPGQNAIVLATGDPHEFVSLYGRIHHSPEAEARMRRAGRATARSYAWPEVVGSVLLPRVELACSRAA